MYICVCVGVHVMVNNDRDLLEHPRVVLVSPYEDLGDRPKCLNNSLLIVVSDGRISEQHLVLVPTRDSEAWINHALFIAHHPMYSTASY